MRVRVKPPHAHALVFFIVRRWMRPGAEAEDSHRVTTLHQRAAEHLRHRANAAVGPGGVFGADEAKFHRVS